MRLRVKAAERRLPNRALSSRIELPSGMVLALHQLAMMATPFSPRDFPRTSQPNYPGPGAPPLPSDPELPREPEPKEPSPFDPDPYPKYEDEPPPRPIDS
jgi:hypothetical protein